MEKKFSVTGAIRYNDDTECFELVLSADSSKTAEKMYKEYLEYCGYKLVSRNLVAVEL